MKRNEKYSHVINFVRVRLRFALLRSVLISIRGVRKFMTVRMIILLTSFLTQNVMKCLKSFKF